MIKEILKGLEEMPVEIGWGGNIRDIRIWLEGYETCLRKAKELVERFMAEEEKGPRAAVAMKEDVWTQEEMEGKEDKANICRQLLPVLQHTRAGENIKGLRYVPFFGLGDEEDEFFGDGDEAVEIKFMNGGTKIVNVTADSGIAMIKDICRAIS